MKIFVVPAGTKTATAAIGSLLEKLAQCDEPLEIKAVYRDPKKALPEFVKHSSFEALMGDIKDASSLDLTGADAVLTMTPPFFNGQDLVSQATHVSQNVRDAIERSGTVERLVYLSSIGAHLSKGVGEIKTNNAAERILAHSKVPQITFVRCSYFMENWTIFTRTLKEPEPYFNSTVVPLDTKFPMVAIKDIGYTLAEQLVSEQKQPRSPYVFVLEGPEEYCPLDVQASLSKAMGKNVAIKAIENNQLTDYYSKIFPPAIVGDWVEMATCFLPGGAAVEIPPPEEERDVVHGRTGLDEALAEAIGAFMNST